MSGLIGQVEGVQPVQPGPADPSQPVQAGFTQQQTPAQVSPSQQPMGKDYQMYVAKGLEIISSTQTRDSIVTLLKSADPVSALANTLVVVIQKLDMAARSKGTEVADFVKISGAHELINRLNDIMTAAKIASLDKNHIELAFSLAVQDYMRGEIKAGRINPAKLQQQQQMAMQKMKPKQRQEIQESLTRIQATAKAYHGGK